MSSPTPENVFRTDRVYRSSVVGGTKGVDCGFLLKPTSEHAYRNRTVPGYVAVYVLRGSGVFIDDAGREHRVEAGCLIQHPPRRRHSLVQDTDGRWAEFFIVLPAEMHATLVAMGSLAEAPTVLRPGLDARHVERCEALLEEVKLAPPHDTAVALARAHELLVMLHRAHLQRQERRHADGIAQACEWLSEDLQHEIDLDALAARLNLSYERFRKLFRQRMGIPPGEYRIRRRIDAARTLIAEDGLTNKEVAFRLGYPDPFTFSKQFKRYVGMSPQAFRRLM